MSDIILTLDSNQVGTIAKKRKRVIFEIPNELHLQFKRECVQRNVSMTDVLLRATQDYVNNPPNPRENPLRPSSSPLATQPSNTDIELTESRSTAKIDYISRNRSTEQPPPLKAYPAGPVWKVRKNSTEAQYLHANTAWVDEAGNQFDADGWIYDLENSTFVDPLNGIGKWMLSIYPAYKRGWKPKTWIEHYDQLLEDLMSAPASEEMDEFMQWLAARKRALSEVVYEESNWK